MCTKKHHKRKECGKNGACSTCSWLLLTTICIFRAAQNESGLPSKFESVTVLQYKSIQTHAQTRRCRLIHIRYKRVFVCVSERFRSKWELTSRHAPPAVSGIYLMSQCTALQPWWSCRLLNFLGSLILLSLIRHPLLLSPHQPHPHLNQKKRDKRKEQNVKNGSGWKINEPSKTRTVNSNQSHGLWHVN